MAVERAESTQSADATGATKIGMAIVRVSPSGSAAANPRRYRVVLEVKPDASRADDMADARSLSMRLLEDAFAASMLGSAMARDVWATAKAHRGQAAVTALTSTEVELECAGLPLASTERLRTLLQENGYRVFVEERRACAEPGCRSEVAIQANRRGRVASGWYSETLCGAHNYKTCPGCSSVFRFESTNSAGAAPSVACTQCGFVLVEWGSSKHWEIELVAASGATS